MRAAARNRMTRIRELRGLSPESRLYPKFVDGLNNTAKVMRQDFAQHFVDLPRKSLALDALALVAME